MSKTINIFALFIFFIHPYFSQISNLGEPLTFKDKVIKTKSFYQAPAVDNSIEIELEDQRSKQTMDKMFRFGKEHSVSINLFESAEKTILPSGDFLYQFGIECKNAISINVMFDKFELAQGVHLYLSDPTNRKFDGAYTSLNNNPSKMLGTELVYSDRVIVEVFVPKEKEGVSILNLGTIVHGYRSLNEMAKSLNSSGSCEIDVNCPLGLGWENQRNSVAMMVNGGGFCTGSLVNNTSGVIIPYFLSANHCGTTPGAWVFRFRWESPAGQADCATGAPSVDGPSTMNINGGTLKANYAASDFTLTLLNSAPDPSWGIYYNGWDRTDIPATQLTCIHHPAGDIKKISRDDSDAVSSSFNNGVANSHWRVPSWDQGVTEGGSSGSPLFNQYHRTIGQLHGGTSSCGAIPANLNDDFGKFFMSWTGGGTSSTRLSDWLDPGNIGSDFIDGVDPSAPVLADDGGITNSNVLLANLCGGVLTPQIEIYNSGTNVLTSATITYGFDGTNNLTYDWTGSLLTNEHELISLTPLTLGAGQHLFESSFLNTSGTDLSNVNDTTSSTFTTVSNGEIVHLSLTINCYSNENSWVISDTLSQVIFASGGAYNDNTPVPILDSFCLATDCYFFKLSDSYGDGMTGNTSGCADGSFIITNSIGTILYELLPVAANFGSLIIAPFCLGDAGIEDNNFDNSISIYPNPSSSIINVQVENDVFDKVKIMTITGQSLYESTTSATSLSIDVSNYSKGIYLIQISNKISTVVKQLIVK